MCRKRLEYPLTFRRIRTAPEQSPSQKSKIFDSPLYTRGPLGAVHHCKINYNLNSVRQTKSGMEMIHAAFAVYPYRLMSKFMFMMALMASALSVMLASPWMVCLMTELATAKLIISMGL